MHLSELQTADFEHIAVLRDADAHFLAFVVIHDTRLGPAFGGIRRWTYPDAGEALQDGLRLARSMTLKCAISDIPGGGGKTVIFDDPDLDRTRAYRAIGACVAQLNGRYYTGPDVGTTAEDLEVVAQETGFVATPSAACGDLGEPTALGVLAGIRATAQRLGFDSLEGVHVAVQGLGEVGGRLAGMLAAEGAALTIADVRADRVTELVDRFGATPAATDSIATTACDVYAPCALGGVVTADTIDTLRCRAIAGSANNVLASPDLDHELHRRGILYAPDFVISSGALIHGSLFHLDGAPPPPERVLSIGDRIGSILDRARAEDRPTEHLAVFLALERLARAPRR